ncbi:MAG: DUF4249 domain-containing protein [Mariniphaga sp.]|nr:DUF4249 domain-containing protein [Mariniphaga sp.]
MKYYILPILLILFIVITACEDVIEVKLTDENIDLYAVEAKITTEDNPYVFFYHGIPVNENNSYPGVSGAKVIISDDSQPSKSIQLVENPEFAGQYIVAENDSFIGEIGKEYTLKIEYNDVTLTAKDNLFPVEPIDSIQVRPSLRGDKRFLAVFTYGNETPGIGDFYKWDLYINNTLLHEAEYLFFASDELVDGNYVENLEVFTDFHDPKEKSERKLQYMDSVYVKQTSISPFAYYFYYQLVNQSFSGSLFSVPTANIKGNFTSSDGKKVLGIFTAHDVSTSNIVVIDESIENQLDERP